MLTPAHWPGIIFVMYAFIYSLSFKKRNDLCKRDRCPRYVLQSCFAMRFKEKARPVQKGSFLSKGLIHKADVFLHQRDRLRRAVA